MYGESNTEALFLCNHCCSGKAISIPHSECVSAAIDIQHAMIMRHIVIYGLCDCIVFFHIISQAERFSTKSILGLQFVSSLSANFV